jgi:hypothetical protein
MPVINHVNFSYLKMGSDSSLMKKDLLTKSVLTRPQMMLKIEAPITMPNAIDSFSSIGSAVVVVTVATVSKLMCVFKY